MSIKDLNKQLIDKIYDQGQVHFFPAGSSILKENSYVRSLPFVLSGSIKVIRKEPDGKEILLYYLKAGESCVMSFLGGLHQDTSKLQVEVEEDADLLMIPIEKLSLLLHQHPELMNYFLKLYHERFEELLSVINDIAFKKVDERLLALLHKKVALTGKQALQITHEQLASELGTSRVVVSRLLKQLELDNRLVLGRNRIEIL